MIMVILGNIHGIHISGLFIFLVNVPFSMTHIIFKYRYFLIYHSTIACKMIHL